MPQQQGPDGSPSIVRFLEEALADPNLPSRIGWERRDYLFRRKHT